MSFRITKLRVADIRKGRPIVSRAESVACGLCKKTIAKYSCPECNVPYCSLECYRGEEHRICSEGFYRDNIEEDIRSAPERTVEEKRAMLDILQRMSDPDAFPDDEKANGEHEDDDLVQKLEDMDIESMDSTSLWEALSQQQKDEFMRAMKDPNSGLAKQLLDSVSSNIENESPWWESSGDLENQSPPSDTPTAITIAPSLLEAARVAWNNSQDTVLYNTFAVCLAYVFCLRTLRIKSISVAQPLDVQACHSLLSQAVPFLTERKSSTRLVGVEEAIQYAQSRLNEPIQMLLHDMSIVFHTPVVTELSISPSMCSPNLMACLGDISSVFSCEVIALSRSAKQAVVRKLEFYAAHAATSPPQILRNIATECQRRHAAIALAGNED